MKDFKELLKDIERDLLVNLLISLKHGKLEKSQVKETAREFVSESYVGYEDLFRRLYELSNSSKEVRKVYVKYAPVYFLEKDAMTLRSMRDYLLNQDFDYAIQVAKGGSYGR